MLLRVSMGLSFYDKESFMEAAGSLRFNNPRSPNTHQRVGTQERSEDLDDIGFNNPSNDPNTLQVQRMGRSSSQDVVGEE
jgi:hypothetical protein